MKSSGQRRKEKRSSLHFRREFRYRESMGVWSWESGVHESGKIVPGKH